MSGAQSLDVDRPVRDVAALADLRNLERWCVQALSTGSTSRHDFRIQDQTFVLRIAPYSKGDNRASGTVLTFTNVTAFRASIDQAIYEREYTKAILNTVTSPLVVLDAHLRVQSGNRAFYSMFGVSREKAHGVPLRNLGGDDWKASGVWASLNVIASAEGDIEPFEVERDFPAIGPRTVMLDARRVLKFELGLHEGLVHAVEDPDHRREQRLGQGSEAACAFRYEGR